MQIVKPTLKTHILHALKICKYEFLMSRILIVIVCIINVINILLLLCDDKNTVVFFVLIFMQYFSFFVCGIAYLLSAAISFYQGVFGRQAYLTHALPISLETIICSKILIYFLWFLVIFASFIFAIYASASNTYFIDYIIYSFHANNERVWNFTLHFIAFTLLTALEEIVFIFMIVALVHRKKTYTLFIGILTYFGIKILLLIVGSVVEGFLPDRLDTNDLLALYYFGQFLLIVLFYFICHRIIKYKLSL